jgi:alpha-1,4-glucan:alpha-1,4-glucan 6-glycosyltransferase/4-alpha-glucanotransferase
MTADVPAALRALASDCGVTLDYVDGTGVHRRADADVLVAVIGALDEPLPTVADAARALRRRRRARLDRMLEPVTVIDEGARGEIVVQLRAADTLLECTIESEDGERTEWRIHRDSLVARSVETFDGREVHVGGIPLPALPRTGYYTFTARVRGRVRTTTVIVAPSNGARGRFADDWRAFGLVAPLFSLHSQRSWGSGDLTDLDELGRLAAAEQASVVATLPLLAGFGPEPFEASPYRPLSREFWHERWIDVERVPELAWSPAAHALLDGPYAPARRAAWVDDGLVDGARVVAAKRAVLQALAGSFERAGPARAAALRDFVHRRPEVVEFARFRAAGERFGTEWRHWPASARGGLVRWNDVDPVSERYYIYAQWIADEQMSELAERFAQRGQTLALDLPVGAHPCGYDVWRHRQDYAPGISVGAPPDGFFARGQSWGFPPPRPEACRSSGHRDLRAALAHHLRVAGLLRIDHIMGLQRLFWVPDGAEPASGVYVGMPLRELMAIVAIEAQRHGADIVGEDLGTVDDALRAAMEHNGVRRTYVAQFGIHPDADPALEAPPAGSVASFGTHDLPTFAGWWEGRDIAERVEYGQLDEARADIERAERERLCVALCDSAADTSAPALARVHDELARSDAGLVLVQLEDLVGQVEAVNLPGTSTERPNWQRRLDVAMEELVGDPRVHDGLAPLREHRSQGTIRTTAGLTRAPETVFGVSRLDASDLHLFNEGRHFRLYEKLGAHPMSAGGAAGCYFAVWAPNAERVAVVGDFNGWDGTRHPLAPVGGSGVWEGFLPGVGVGDRYKYRVRSRLGGHEFDKADPYARRSEEPPATASVIWSDSHEWGDQEWIRTRADRQGVARPMSIYEVHLGSWRRVPEAGNRWLSYTELAPLLIEHVHRHGFTHVELLPIMEHPFYGSWGYQATGFFAPTARYGTPDDFAALVDGLHQAGIGVILDWVPSHFPSDGFALAEFDGTHLYEHADPRQRVHPDWGSWIFNYDRNEVRSFIVSNACFWLDHFHIDGLRVDAVASMLYLDYSRQPGEWVPNRFGGNENLEAIALLQQANIEAYGSFPDVVTIAEESTAWPGVSQPAHLGGLGFGFKWDMGWMHDTLDYFAREPVHRPWHHDELTFRAIYADTEHFVLPLSHDEVVHGKGSLLERMAGDDWQRFANLRLLYGYQFTQTGKKLMFMGDEFAQRTEWNHDASLDWHLLEQPAHAGIATWVRRLNELYRNEAALHRDDLGGRAFAWIACDDRAHSVLCYERRDDAGNVLVVVANFTPIPREAYRVGMPGGGRWEVAVNSDAPEFGGSGYPVPDGFIAEPVRWHDRDHSAELTLPPLALMVLRPIA